MTTDHAPGLARVAAALAEPTRARIMTALLDGRAWTAGELAAHCAIAASSCTEHLHRLVDAGLLTEVRQGRHRYVRIAGPQVAEVVEALAALAPPADRAMAPRTLRSRRDADALAAGRTCYRHLAGRLGIAVTAAWQEMGVLHDWQVSEQGRDWFVGLGIDVPTAGRRPLVRPCLDWTERVEHAAGVLPDAFALHGLDVGWWRRGPHPRSVVVTQLGRTVLAGAGLPIT